MYVKLISPISHVRQNLAPVVDQITISFQQHVPELTTTLKNSCHHFRFPLIYYAWVLHTVVFLSHRFPAPIACPQPTSCPSGLQRPFPGFSFSFTFLLKLSPDLVELSSQLEASSHYLPSPLVHWICRWFCSLFVCISRHFLKQSFLKRKRPRWWIVNHLSWVPCTTNTFVLHLDSQISQDWCHN